MAPAAGRQPKEAGAQHRLGVVFPCRWWEGKAGAEQRQESPPFGCSIWSRRQRIEELLGIEPSGLDEFPPLYNITPGTNAWIARAKGGKPALYSNLWGLVPCWSKDPKKGG